MSTSGCGSVSVDGAAGRVRLAWTTHPAVPATTVSSAAAVVANRHRDRTVGLSVIRTRSNWPAESAGRAPSGPPLARARYSARVAARVSDFADESTATPSAAESNSRASSPSVRFFTCPPPMQR